MGSLGSFSQTERRRQARARRRERAQHVLDHGSDDEVLTFLEWCALNKISERTGQRIIHGPNGPVVTMLAAKRIGITRGNNRRWQASRARA
jgi:hypothetical protein